MSLFTSIKRAFIGDPGEPTTLDHVPVSGTSDWREAKLAEAARRYGKPFKCAGDGVLRQVRKQGVDVIVVPNVTKLHARKPR